MELDWKFGDTICVAEHKTRRIITLGCCSLRIEEITIKNYRWASSEIFTMNIADDAEGSAFGQDGALAVCLSAEAVKRLLDILRIIIYYWLCLFVNLLNKMLFYYY